MAEYRLFDAVSGGNREDDPDALTGVSLGTEFYVLNSGRSAVRLWYWHPTGSGDTAQRIGRIYRVTDQVVVAASVTFPVGTSGTWVSVDLPAPVPLTANTRYKVVIWHPAGHFALTTSYWHADRIINTDLVGVSHPNATGGGQCTYDYGAAIQYPTSTFDRSNYWADVTVSDSSGGQTVSPARIETAAVVHAPTLTPGAVTLAPVLVEPTAAVYAPVLAPGAVTLAPGRLESTVVLYAPALTPGPVTVAPARIESGAVLYTPTLTAGDTIAPARIESTATLYTPSLTPGPVTLQPARIEPTAVLYTPTLSGGEQVEDDYDITVGRPYARWAAGEPHVAWTADTPRTGWEVGDPWL